MGAEVIVTLTIMPESPDINLEEIQKTATQAIVDYAGEQPKLEVDIQPVAFGLKSLNITFRMDEDIGSTEPVEEACAKITGVTSAEITNVTRAFG